MKCHEARRRLDVFMDNELDVAENLRILEHLNLCPGCAETFEAEKLLREGIVEALRVPAPAGLREKIRARARWGWRRLAVAAAVLGIVGVASVVLWPKAPSAAALVSEAVRFHRQSVAAMPPGGIEIPQADAGDALARLGSFYGRKLDYEPCLHDLRELGYDFTHGSFWTFRGRLVCWTQQRSGANVLSHASLPMEVSDPSMQVEEHDGRTVVMARVRGLT